MSVFTRLKKAREEKKGFTLVELIVVLVILAILAAILVPALLGWIDEARNKQHVLTARNVVIAAQTVADELYAAGKKVPKTEIEGTNANPTDSTSIGKIAKIADVTALTISDTNLSDTVSTKHADYTITKITLEFTSEGYKVNAKLADGAWEITKVEKTTEAAGS